MTTMIVSSVIVLSLSPMERTLALLSARCLGDGSKTRGESRISCGLDRRSARSSSFPPVYLQCSAEFDCGAMTIKRRLSPRAMVRRQAAKGERQPL
jgi:hypothetical protein